MTLSLTNATGQRYRPRVLPELRDHAGAPNAKVRLAALLVVIGAVVGTAPVVVVPVAGFGWHQVQRLWP